MKKKYVINLKKCAAGILTAILAAVLFLNVSTLLSVHSIKSGAFIKSGYFCAIVSSGSMEPTISVNDLLVIAASDFYQAEDIVTYVSPRGSLVTHRVVEAFDRSYLTKGDANNVPDDKVAAQKILGQVVAIIPGVGGLVNGLLSPAGIILLICVFVLVWSIRRIWRGRNETKQDPENEIFGHQPEQ